VPQFDHQPLAVSELAERLPHRRAQGPILGHFASGRAVSATTSAKSRLLGDGRVRRLA
jgi:hypothetical protein